jgi:acyl transferase domain-containing protein
MNMFTVTFLTVSVTIAGWVVVYVALRRLLMHNNARLRLEFRRQVESLVACVEEATTVSIAVSETVCEAGIPAPENAIAAAAAALASKKIQVRALPVDHANAGNRWAQQGRAGVQSSHDIAQRGH